MTTAAVIRRVAACALVAACAVLAAACSGGGQAKRIVYEARHGAATDVFTIDPKSGDTRQITDGAKFSGNPAWSPDGKRVIFTSDRDATPPELYTADADGGNVRRLTDTPGAGEWSAKYSPDGKRIAYARQEGDAWSLWVMNADASDQHELAGPYKFAEFPAWAPGGGEVYYSAILLDANDDDASPGYGRAHIFSVDMNSREVKTRIATRGPDVCPHFSRDGKRLTYASPRDGDEAHLDIFAHDMASDDTTGAADTPITGDPARDDYANASPDDREMVFVSDRDGNPELYLMSRDGSNQRRLTTTPDVRENVPDW